MHFRIALMTNALAAENNLEKNAKLWVLIPCGGSGSRASTKVGDVPKQYHVIAGKPMVMHTLAAFEHNKRLAGGLVVISKEDDHLPELLKAIENTIFSIAPQAGNTRSATVFNGLKALKDIGASDTDWVLVHDAARCLITPELINKLIDACEQDAVGGLLALPLPDTLKMGMTGRVAATLDRSDKWLAQTPQMFRIGTLREALVMTGERVTDESSAIEAMGLSPKLVPGSAQNFKVTYPEDFALAQAVLQARLRTGNPAVARLNQGNSDYDYP